MTEIQQDRFLLSVIPPQIIIDFIDTYRRKYSHYTSYDIAPHLTIYPPFYSQVPQVDLVTKLQDTFSQTQPFPVTLNSIDFFTGKNNVAFFKPDHKSSIDIKNLLIKTRTDFSQIIQNVWPDYPTDPNKFIPHLTIAEHIPDDKFEQVIRELANIKIKQEFEVRSIFLLKKQQENYQPTAEILFPLNH